MDNNDSKQPRGRRVSDKPGVPFDVAAQAVALKELEGENKLLAQRVSSAMENVTNALAEVQREVRTCTTRVSELAGLQGAHDSSNIAIGDVKNSLKALDGKLQDWFDDFDQRNNHRWERYEANRDQWRERHEAENENVQKDLASEIRSVRETVIRFVGFGSALGALASVVIGGFLYTMNYRFDDNKEDTDRVEKTSGYNKQLIDQVSIEHGKELADIKLYLARGGRIPDEPYVPQSQRNNNGQQHSGQPAK